MKAATPVLALLGAALFLCAPLLAAEKPKVGIFFFQHLHQEGEKAPVGSGIDYGEEVLLGFLDSGLFDAGQVLLTTSLDDEELGYVVGADSIGFSKEGASCFIRKPGREEPLKTLNLPLPASWDKPKGGVSLAKGRALLMRRLGRDLAGEVARLMRSKP